MITTILAIIAAFAAIFGFNYLSKKTDDAVLAENNRVKDKLKETDVKIEENNRELQTEDIKRSQLREDIKKEQDEKVSNDDIIDFFNGRK